MARRPVFWFSCRDARRRAWKVYLVVPGMGFFGEDDEEYEDHAETNLDRRRIYLNARKPVGSWEETVMHELGHAALANTGIVYRESFIECHAVNQLPILKSLGFRLPPPPRAAFLLRRTARSAG